MLRMGRKVQGVAAVAVVRTVKNKGDCRHSLADFPNRECLHEVGWGVASRGKLAAMKKQTIRVVTRGTDGQIRIRDYDSPEDLLKRHSQIGIDDCCTDLTVRGLPVFRGLIGPIPEAPGIVRYESPEVFETLTKEWSSPKPGRTRTRTQRGNRQSQTL